MHHKSRSYDVWFLRYKMQRTKFLSFWTIFCPLTLPTTQNIKVLKNKKRAWRYYHFTLVYHIWRSYDVWFLTYQVQQTYFFITFDYLLSFYPPNNPENQNFEKNNKSPGNIIILHMSTINKNHLMYDSWDMDRVFCHFESFFALLPPPLPPHL